MKLTPAQKQYRIITRDFANNKEAGFVANVIMTSCTKPTTKLRTLIALLLKGVSVRTAQFDMLVLIVDGKAHNYSYLDAGK